MDEESRRIEHRLGIASWGAFLLWLGACFIVGLGWDTTLIGVAAIIWLTQAVRIALKLDLQPLWLVVGALFAGAGLWHLFDVSVAFGPVVLVVAGAALLLAALIGGRRRYQH